MVEEKVYVDPETGKTIPMKDGKPCRVCVDFKTWSKLEKEKNKKDSNADSKPAAAKIETPKPKEETTTEEWKRNNCPADVATLGRSTWTLLHTMAAYYPEKPSQTEQVSMKTFFESFSEHYPCWFCKNDFKKDMAENPIDVTSRETLSEWLCRRHNTVNAKLGKKQFDCSKVFERWLSGPPNGKCDD